jgi:hypothetical protein
MSDLRNLLADMRRPAMLIRAARFGLVDYRRDRDLRRLIHSEPSPDRALPQLIEVEEQIEETRRAGDAGYSVSRHIDVLIAVLGEARMLPREPLRLV